ncbi:MAG: hypothetical protein ACH34X_10730 [Thiolinea sp.]
MKIYTSMGVRQSEAGDFSLADRQNELKAAGIQVLTASCGSDRHAYVCGSLW